MLIALIEAYMPQGWRLWPERLLKRIRLPMNVVILRLVGEPATYVRKLHCLFDPPARRPCAR